MFKLGLPECTTAGYGNRADVLGAEVPAGGTVTARAVARMYAASGADRPVTPTPSAARE